jgi:hypothetical protein
LTDRQRKGGGTRKGERVVGLGQAPSFATPAICVLWGFSSAEPCCYVASSIHLMISYPAAVLIPFCIFLETLYFSMEDGQVGVVINRVTLLLLQCTMIGLLLGPCGSSVFWIHACISYTHPVMYYVGCMYHVCTINS